MTPRGRSSRSKYRVQCRSPPRMPKKKKKRGGLLAYQILDHSQEKERQWEAERELWFCKHLPKEYNSIEKWRETWIGLKIKFLHQQPKVGGQGDRTRGSVQELSSGYGQWHVCTPHVCDWENRARRTPLLYKGHWDFWHPSQMQG